MASSGEAVPPIAVPPVELGVEIPPEPPDVAARGLYVASRLLAGATTFFFLGFVFAYFYLRALNQDDMWRPAHVKPEQGLGAAIIACVLVSAVLAYLAGRQMKPRGIGMAGSRLRRDPPRGGGLRPAGRRVLTSRTSAPPTAPTQACSSPGRPATWSPSLGALYWLETQVATEVRARRSPSRRDGDIRNPDRLIAPGLSAAAFYWAFLAAIGAITYVVLYLL